MTSHASGNLRVLMSADTVGGVFSYAVDLARGLCARGAEVALATMGGPLSCDQRVVLTGVPRLSVFESEFSLEWMREPWLSVDAAGRWLLRIAEQFQPDVVHLNGYSHASLPWGVKKLVVAHSCVVSWWRAVRGADPPLEFTHYHERVEAGLSAADLLVAPSRAMLADLRACYRFETPARVIHNGVDAGVSVIGNKQPVYLAAGRLWDEGKNLQLVARIARDLPWRALVAGEPPTDAAKCEGLELLGRLARDRTREWMAMASAFLHPARYEPFGLAPLEAALAGTPLVLGDIPSLREIWGDTALYVSPNDAPAFLRVAASLAGDRDRRIELGRLARTRALRYSAEHMAQRYLGAYRELLGGGAAARTALVGAPAVANACSPEAW